MGKKRKDAVKKSKVAKPEVEAAKPTEETKPALSVMEGLEKALAENKASGNTAAVAAIQKEINRQKARIAKSSF